MDVFNEAQNKTHGNTSLHCPVIPHQPELPSKQPLFTTDLRNTIDGLFFLPFLETGVPVRFRLQEETVAGVKPVFQLGAVVSRWMRRHGSRDGWGAAAFPCRSSRGPRTGEKLQVVIYDVPAQSPTRPTCRGC
jgi:hypothetical protein